MERAAVADGVPPLVGRAAVAAALGAGRDFYAGAAPARLVRDLAVVAGADAVHVSCRGLDGGWRLAAVLR